MTAAPARSASATPSPVDTAGLVVDAKIWPMPPVASTTARARIAPTPSSVPSPSTCRVMPQARPVGVAQQVEHQRVLDQPDPRVAVHGGVQRPLHLGAGRVAAGVHDPVGVVAALAGQHQRAVRVAVELGARAASARGPGPGPPRPARRPPPGRTARRRRSRCRSACASGVSSGSSTAAMPPCAQRVEPSSMLTLVTTVTCRPASRRCSAAVRPAMPEPTTTTSVVSAQPGSAAGEPAGQRRQLGTSDIRSVNPADRRRHARGRRTCAGLLGRPTLAGRPLSPLPLSEAVSVADPEPQVAAHAPVARAPRRPRRPAARSRRSGTAGPAVVAARPRTRAISFAAAVVERHVVPVLARVRQLVRRRPHPDELGVVLGRRTGRRDRVDRCGACRA